jgi:phosphate transport system permease protein
MTATGSPIRLEDLQVAPGRARTQRVLRRLFFAAALLAIVISAGIILSLLNESLAFITNVDPASLFNGIWEPRSLRFDLPTLIAGSFVIAFIGMLIAAPLGLGAAIYLAEYANPRVRAWLKPILEILASIPSVVLGVFALSVLSPTVVDPICPGPTIPFNMVSAGLAVGVLITPLIASIAEDALYAVPGSLREASYGLGARKRTTVLRVVAPAAVSGIAAALIVGLSRAVGETMIVLVAMGQQPNLTFDPREAAEAMTAFIAATGAGDVPTGSIEYKTIFAVGATLFVLTLAMNVVAIRLVRKYREVYE